MQSLDTFGIYLCGPVAFFRDVPLTFMTGLFFTTLDLKKKQIEVHKFLNFKYTYLIHWARFRKMIHHLEEIANFCEYII